MTPASVRDAVEPTIEQAGLVLEDLTIHAAGTRRVVRVIVDLPDDRVGGLDLDAVAVVSASVGRALDTSGAIGESAYVLEVSSPGVDRPLTEPRHWRRARTRLVSVPVRGRQVDGRVIATDEHGVTLQVDGQVHPVSWADLGVGQVHVEFSRATGPEDADGAGEEH